MGRSTIAVAALALGLGLLGGCGEKPQTASGKKSDAKAWTGADNAYVAGGWKPGDESSWETQLRNRSQGQNEYSRTAGKP